MRPLHITRDERNLLVGLGVVGLMFMLALPFTLMEESASRGLAPELQEPVRIVIWSVYILAVLLMATAVLFLIARRSMRMAAGSSTSRKMRGRPARARHSRRT